MASISARPAYRGGLKSARVILPAASPSYPSRGKELTMRKRPFRSELRYQLPCRPHVSAQTSGATLEMRLISSSGVQTTPLADLRRTPRSDRSSLKRASRSGVIQ